MTTISNFSSRYLKIYFALNLSVKYVEYRYLAFYIYDAFYDVIHGNVPKEMVHYQSNYPIIE